jgi:valyl-tRNA synthetase
MLFQCSFIDKSVSLDSVLLHGLIRDEQGRKMSKSLGNGIDPIDVIERYGADSLRAFLISSSTAGEDVRYSEQKLQYI